MFLPSPLYTYLWIRATITPQHIKPPCPTNTVESYWKWASQYTGYGIMHPRFQSVWSPPIIPKLLSFRFGEPLVSVNTSPCPVPRERSTKEQVRSQWTHGALIKNYHPTTTKGPLARFTLAFFLAPPLIHLPSLASLFPSAPRPPRRSAFLLFFSLATSPYLSPRRESPES